jgi:cell division protein ZapA (FtsZ GTPase activity inhibitor)
MADKADLVHVEIFGQTYAVKAGGDPGYVEKLAALVDEQLSAVSTAIRTRSRAPRPRTSA